MSLKITFGSGGWGFKSLRARHIVAGKLATPSADIDSKLIGYTPMQHNGVRRGRFLSPLYGALLLGLIVGCSGAAPVVSGRKAEQPRGFFANLVDQVTERECNVIKFTCPYGFGSAGELCECVDPKGIVLKGLTIK